MRSPRTKGSTFGFPAAAGMHVARRVVRQAAGRAGRGPAAGAERVRVRVGRSRRSSPSGPDGPAVESVADRADRTPRRAPAIPPSRRADLHLPSRQAERRGGRAPGPSCESLARRAYRRPVERVAICRRCSASTTSGRSEAELRARHPARQSSACWSIPTSCSASSATRRRRRGARSTASAISSSRRGCRSSCGAAFRTTSCSTSRSAAGSGSRRCSSSRCGACWPTPIGGARRQLRQPVAVAPHAAGSVAESGSVPRVRREPARRVPAARRGCSSPASSPEDRSVVDLLTADYTFLNERLARHYGDPRRVRQSLPPGHAGPTRSRRAARAGQHPDGDVVRQRGPRRCCAATGCSRTCSARRRRRRRPTCPALAEKRRGRPAAHRSASASSSIARIPRAPPAIVRDGSARLRARELRRDRAVADDSDAGAPIDASGALPDGTTFEGVAGPAAAIWLSHREQFVGTVTDKLLTYALGRGVEYLRPAGDSPIARGRRRRRLPLVGDHSRHREERAVSDAEGRIMIVTKKALDRADGAARPRRDAGAAAARQHGAGVLRAWRRRAARPGQPPRRRLRAERHPDGALDAAGGRRRLRAHARSCEPLAPVPRAHAWSSAACTNGQVTAVVGRARPGQHQVPDRRCRRSSPQGADLAAGVSHGSVGRRRSSAGRRSWGRSSWRSSRPRPGPATSASAAPTPTPSPGASATTPLPMEHNPRAVFERLFGDGGSTDPRGAAARGLRSNRSILDSVTEKVADSERDARGRATARS